MARTYRRNEKPDTPARTRQGRTRGADPPLESVATVVQKLAVLLAAGVAPASSWLYISEGQAGPARGVLEDVGTAAQNGRPVAEAIIESIAGLTSPTASAWRGLAAAWKVATDAGAPLSPTLTDFAASLRSLAQLQRDRQVALAGPVATARLVMVLPAVGVLFGLALGFDSLTTLLATVPGLACLFAGVALMLVARWWSARLVVSAAPTELTPGLVLDLMAIAVSGGASIPRARVAVDEATALCGLVVPRDGRALDEVLRLSSRAGVPAAALLRSEAEEARRAARSDGERRAATLAVTLMLPLGICVLPAFMLLGVAPLLISVVSSTVDSL